MIKKGELSAAQKKKALPGCPKIRKKLQDGVEYIKSRYVGGGHLQDENDYDIYREISSPTANVSSVLAVIADASMKGKKVMTLDVGQAYLNADLSEEDVIIRIDEDTVKLLKEIDKDTNYDMYIEKDKKGNYVAYAKLNKALYGLLQSARKWYEHLRAVMLKFGYKHSLFDPCIFNKFNKDGVIVATAAFHVDDGIIVADNDELLNELEKNFLNEFEGEVKIRRGVHHEYLGMELDFSIQNRVMITQLRYINELIETWKVTKFRETPAKPNLFNVDENSVLFG